MEAFGKNTNTIISRIFVVFLILIYRIKPSNDQRKNIASDSKTIAIFATADNFAQTLYLSSNPKAENEVQKVLSNYQLASYKGKEQKTADGWKSKQVIGSLNPGDIYLYNKEEVGDTIQRTYIRTRSVKSQTTTTEMGGATTKTKGVEKGL